MARTAQPAPATEPDGLAGHPLALVADTAPETTDHAAAAATPARTGELTLLAELSVG
jgi:hypothetical protein